MKSERSKVSSEGIQESSPLSEGGELGFDWVWGMKVGFF